MAGFVQNYGDIIAAIENVPHAGKRFLFFAFDERPSHRVVLDFLIDSADWLDHLSSSSGVFTLSFARKWVFEDTKIWRFSQRIYTSGDIKYMGELDGKNVFVNPTLELAKRFGIQSMRLPGIFIFESVQAKEELPAIFVPLKLEYFTEQGVAEDTISTIYSCVNKTLSSLRNSDQYYWMEALRTELQDTLNIVAQKLESKSKADLSALLLHQLPTQEDIRHIVPYDPQLRELKNLLDEYDYSGGIIVGTMINTGGGTVVGGDVQTEGDFIGQDKVVHGDDVTGDKIEGDKVMGNKVGGSQTTIGNDNSDIIVGDGNTQNITGGIDVAQIDSLFASMLTVAETGSEKQLEAIQTIAELKVEATKGDKADDKKIAKLIEGFIALVPAGVSAVASAFTSPILGSVAGPATEYVIDKIQGK